MFNILPYKLIAQRYGCELDYNIRLHGHILTFKDCTEVIFKLDKKSLSEFESYCIKFITKGDEPK